MPGNFLNIWLGQSPIAKRSPSNIPGPKPFTKNLKNVKIVSNRISIGAETPDIVPWPSRFKVRVGKVGLAKLLLKELIQVRDVEVVTSRPCIYGVFSGPVGGFAPIEEKCVGCLRCTTEHPDFVRIECNPERQKLGDSNFTSGYVDAIAYEAASGRIPVRGAGYRGRFSGEGWDGMWTDMSEIVRPTRDSIHGREFISTVVDIGHMSNHLLFDGDGRLSAGEPQSFTLSLPLLFDLPPLPDGTPAYYQILAEMASAIDSLVFLPFSAIVEMCLASDQVAPLLATSNLKELDRLAFEPRLPEEVYRKIKPAAVRALQAEEAWVRKATATSSSCSH